MKKFNYLIAFLCYMLVSSGCSLNSDDEDNQDKTGSTITDKDGNVYKTVIIGTQTWMAENLRTTKFSNGEPITEEKTLISYENESESKFRNILLNNNYTIPYGRTYNSLAVKDTRNICPKGWHIPSPKEWQILFDYLTSMGYGHDGSGYDIAKSLASATKWTSSSIAGTPGNDPNTNNKSGFNAFPSGGIGYGPVGNTAVWFSTEIETLNNRPYGDNLRGFMIKYNESKTFTSWFDGYFPCRCLKD